MAKTTKKVESHKSKISVKVPKVVLPKVDFRELYARFSASIKGFLTYLKNNPRFTTVLAYTLLFVATFAIVDLSVQFLNNNYAIAVVNGSRIPKSEYTKLLENSYGSQIVDKLVKDELIRQEANRRKIVVTKEDTQTEIAKLEESEGGAEVLDQKLSLAKITREDLHKYFQIEIYKKKMLASEYTEEDLQAFYTKNEKEIKSIYGEDSTLDKVRADIENAYEQQLVSKGIDELMTRLQTEAVIQNNVTSTPKYAVFGTTSRVIKGIYTDIVEGLRK